MCNNVQQYKGTAYGKPGLMHNVIVVVYSSPQPTFSFCPRTLVADAVLCQRYLLSLSVPAARPDSRQASA